MLTQAEPETLDEGSTWSNRKILDLRFMLYLNGKTIDLV